MKTRNLTSEDAQYVTLLPNVPAAGAVGIATPIAKWQVPNGSEFSLENWFDTRAGRVTGCPMVLDLNTTAGIRIASRSQIHLAIMGGTMEVPKHLRTLPYSAWHGVPRMLQSNVDYKETIGRAADLNFQGGKKIDQQYWLILSVTSTDFVDWNKSYVEIPVMEGVQGEFARMRL